uniref:Uncharacterized protein n=1 Tax=Eutreptiella gymnastica TaxID=73025 RepID=A0A7S4G241_9EUGL
MFGAILYFSTSQKHMMLSESSKPLLLVSLFCFHLAAAWQLLLHYQAYKIPEVSLTCWPQFAVAMGFPSAQRVPGSAAEATQRVLGNAAEVEFVPAKHSSVFRLF